MFFPGRLCDSSLIFIWIKAESGLTVLPFETAVWYVEINLMPA